MADHNVPTHEQQVVLVNEAQERMIGRARSWLEDSKVRAALDHCEASDNEPRRVG